MEYMDKKFAELRNIIDELQDKDINKKVLVKGEELEFEESKFFNDKVSIMMPKTFEDMPEITAKFKYPSENRPKIIKSNKDGTVNITLNYLDMPLFENQVEELQKQIKEGVIKINPTVTFYNEEIIDNGINKIGYYDFKTMALDGSIYNINFTASIENKLFLGTFNCNVSDAKEWKIVILQMIHTLKDLTK